MAFTENGVTVTNYFAKISDYSMYLPLGGAQVFGNNSFGQLGTNNQTNYTSPVTLSSYNYNDALFLKSGQGVALLDQNNKLYTSGNINYKGVLNPLQSTSQWSKIACSYQSATGIKTDGTLWAWGLNSYGQLGLGNQTQANTPVQVGNLSNWTNISSTDAHTLALKSNATAWAWGNNAYGQLGQGNTVNVVSPIILGTQAYTWNSAFVSNQNGVATRTDGTVWIWGNNAYGQLGVGDITNRSSPIQFGGSVSWKQISLGYMYTIGIQTDGTLWSCGYNRFGNLGSNNTQNYSSLVQVGTLKTWKQVSPGDNFVSAIQTDGTLWTWGRNIGYNLGVTDTTSRSTPIQIGSDSNWNTVSTGSTAAMAIKNDGTLWGWGSTNYGAIGAPVANPITPVQMTSFSNWSQISCGYQASAAIRADGTLWVSGNNSYGILGLGDLTHRSTYTQVGALSNWSSVGVGQYHAVALKTDGTIWSWGYNNTGQLGLNTTTSIFSSPVQIGNLSNWANIYTHQDSAWCIAINSNGYMFDWGWNAYGQLGQFDLINRSTPTQFGQFDSASMSTWAQVSAGPNHTVALNSLGRIYVCGNNSFGQLGVIDLSHRSTLTQAGSGNTWVNISAASGNYTSAIKNDGTLWMCGNNQFGQLGQNNTSNYSSLVQVGSLANVNTWTAIANGGIFNPVMSAVKSDGTLWMWGCNSYGTLGFGDITHRYSPTQLGTDSNWAKVVQIATEIPKVFAIKTDGSMWSCGYGGYQLGTSQASLAKTSTFSQVAGSWSQVAIGGGSSGAAYGIKTDGSLWSWGTSVHGSLGNISMTSSSVPRSIAVATSNWASVAAGIYTGLAVNSAGELWTWGSNSYGQLGLNTSTTFVSTPVQVATDTNWKQVFAADHVAFALKNNGTLWAWGSNTNGQLGLSDKTDRSSPTQIGTDSNWSFVSTNGYTTSAIKNDGTLWKWQGSSTSYPVQIATFSTWSTVCAGSDFVVLDSSGIAYIAGDNSFGTYGQNNNATQNANTITRIGGVGTLISNFAQVSSGWHHTVAVTSNGTLWALGYNSYGQLGLGNTTNRSLIVQIGNLSNWSKVNAGTYNTTALKTDGTLWAWGSNSYGQLGQGDYTHRSSPIQVGSLSNWSNAAPGYTTLYAIDSDNTLWNCGTNSYGVLGITQHTNTLYPKLVSQQTFKNIKTSKFNIYSVDNLNNNIVQTSDDDIPLIDPSASIAWTSYNTGNYHFVGVKTDGTAWSIGNNFYGQLGLSDSVYRRSLTQIGARTDWAKVYCAEFGSMLIDNSMNAWAFGKNDVGQLGFSDTTNRYSPVQIVGVSQVTAASMDDRNTWVIDANRTLWETGANNSSYWGTTVRNIFSSPIQIGTALWSQVSSAYNSAIAIQSNGTLWGWGLGSSGQLGLSDLTDRSSPVQVGIALWTQVTGHGTAILAIKSDGTLWAWGANGNGQLGLGDQINRSTPVQIGTNLWKQVFSADHTAAIQSNGTLWTWGGGGSGQLGTSNTVSRSSPVQVGTDLWKQVSCGGDFTTAIQSNGTLWTWGRNSEGQLGTSDLTNRSSPVQIGTALWKQVSAGSSYQTAAIQSNGTLWTWGYNNLGQLGSNTIASRSSPVQIGTDLWKQVSCGGFFTAAIQSNGTLWTWGYNGQGQLGTSDLTQRLTPVQVGSASWSQVDAGNSHILAIQSNGTLWAWGINQNGQLGDLMSYPFFQQKSASNDTYNSVSSNLDNTLFTKTDGTIWAVGNNSFGALGLGNTTTRSSPVQVGSINNVVKVETKNNSSVLLIK